METPLKIGDVVALTVDFLDSIAPRDKSRASLWRGKIQSFIDMDSGETTGQPSILTNVAVLSPLELRGLTQTLNVGNLCRPGSLKFVERTPRRENS